MRKLFLAFALALAVSTIPASANIFSDFRPALDSMSVLLRERTTVDGSLEVTQIVKRDDKVLDFHFKKSLGYYPWHEEDVRWFREQFKSLFPKEYSSYKLGRIKCGTKPFPDMITPELGNSGNPDEFRYRVPDPKGRRIPPVREAGARQFERGLSGRTIALWHSHGRYYSEKEDRWTWQRAPVHTTVEDMYTLSYVLPFIIPMFENAGAYVVDPRERDTQPMECIIDNDPDFGETREGMTRRSGFYAEQGLWGNAGLGFADSKEFYLLGETPFSMGTARQCACSPEGGCTAKWTPDIEKRGRYAVYVSYKSLPESTSEARYKVRYMGGEKIFLVNQTICGGTWVYLGTFEMDKGTDSFIELDNKGQGGTVTADAVKIGGGIGKYARGPVGTDKSAYTTSGLPSFAEGSLYWTLWSGADSTLTKEWDDDYTKDFAGRGAWTSWMCGGSDVNPDTEGKGLPIDLSLAIHSDAGTAQADSTVGTLAIYSSVFDKDKNFPDGRPRACSRSLADLIQSQICNDIRAGFDSSWNRRGLWDKAYSECRRTSVPGIIIEILSHQNFADMRLGLDPAFRFAVSRAIYKGALKFLSNYYGVPYTVQPLPVREFAVRLSESGNEADLLWKPQEDALEPTATPDSYILQTRIDGGCFDGGVELKEISTENGFLKVTRQIVPGRLYSFRITAVNAGGYSMPSEVLCAGIPQGRRAGRTVCAVNNFDRVGAPLWFDSPVYAGFDSRIDSGVGLVESYEHIGNVFEFRRDAEWINDDEPGFGATTTNLAAVRQPGNSFDNVFRHCHALMDNGYACCSANTAALVALDGFADKCLALDLVCGKQVRTPVGNGRYGVRHQVLTEGLRRFIDDYVSSEHNIIISGANIGTDVWSGLYHIPVDSTERAENIKFVEKTMGYKWHNANGCSIGVAEPVKGGVKCDTVRFRQSVGGTTYAVENPDGITPASKGARTVMRYGDSKISAAVYFKSPSGHKAASFGFPLEAIEDDRALRDIYKDIMNFITQ